jgi:hypothetical protein
MSFDLAYSFVCPAPARGKQKNTQNPTIMPQDKKPKNVMNNE